MRVLVITADQFEDRELTEPVEALKGANAGVDVASLEAGTMTGKKGTQAQANLAVGDVDPSGYAMLVLPGGKAPARLRESGEVLDLVRSFVEDGKPVAAICHGPQILISAGLVAGRRMTSYESVANELKDAGALYVDEPVAQDGNFITSRHPGDLAVFIDQIQAALQPGPDAA